MERLFLNEKLRILRIWRLAKHIDHSDLSARELAQWDVLEQKLGQRGLSLGSTVEKPLTELRIAPPPPLSLRVVFGKGQRVRAIYKSEGAQVDIPKDHTGGTYWLYCIVKELTETTGICTYADLAHALWPSELEELPSTNTISVQANKLNKKLDGGRIQSVWGRGLRFVPPQLKAA